MEVIYQKLITSPFDILEADIIDFNRLNGCWNNSGDAVKTIFSWFDSAATITKAKIHNFHDAPIRDDFPNWEHIGGHVGIGKSYWNWFYWSHEGGELKFGDSPDFYGTFKDGAMFWGDIGKVSASAFAMTQKGMSSGDLWISLIGDGSEQIIVEPAVDICSIHGEMILNG